MCENHKKRKGFSKSEGIAHTEDHEYFSRRTFLNTLGLAGASTFLLNKIPVNAFGVNTLQAAINTTQTDRVLVLVRLKGGNDGLNTFIPLTDYGTYETLRPTLKIAQNNLIDLNGEIAIPNYMQDVMQFYNEGKMKVIQSVGYPYQNLSHFTSSDVWASADNTPQANLTTGFVGRFFDQEYPDYLLNPPAIPPAIQIGSRSNLLFTGEQTQMGMSFANPNTLSEIAATGSLYDVANVPDCYYGEQLAFARAIANTTFIYADVIKDAYDSASNISNYNSTVLQYSNFGEQLAIVARLIKGNLGTKVYLVELDGFDTHALQNPLQPQLVEAVAQGMKLFFEDLDDAGISQNVLAVTISEFGRRIGENGGFGTDHGSAAPMMLFSGDFENNDIIGNNIDFSNLDINGNLDFETDFRSVYATILEDWLCVDPTLVDDVLNDSFLRIEGLLRNCNDLTSATYLSENNFYHKAKYLQNQQIAIEYNLPTAGKVEVSIFNINGQKLFTLKNEMQTAGNYNLTFNSKSKNLPFGNYIYRIAFKGKAFSGKISIF